MSRRYRVATYEARPHDDCSFNIVAGSKYKDNIGLLLRAGRRRVRTFDTWDKLGTVCWLVPKRDNPHEPHAVAVYAGTPTSWDEGRSLRVGYIPGRHAQILFPALVKPAQVRGVIVGKRGRYSVKLDADTMYEALFADEG
ncbi:MAG: HIRAN domain-containing protein [bacterium]|nr:HIRAN domain-containing protein [bacterium]